MTVRFSFLCSILQNNVILLLPICKTLPKGLNKPYIKTQHKSKKFHHLSLYVRILRGFFAENDNIFYFVERPSMGACTPRANGSQDYRLSENNSFFICERDPVRAENTLEIQFIFDGCIPTFHTIAEDLDQKPHKNRYQIPIKKIGSEIQTTLDEVGLEIEKGFKKAGQLNCTKVVFLEPKCEGRDTNNMLFNEIIRMLVYFDQKGMFARQSKVYINWSNINIRANIMKMMNAMII